MQTVTYSSYWSCIPTERKRCGQTLVLAGWFSGEGKENAWILKAGKIPEFRLSM